MKKILMLSQVQPKTIVRSKERTREMEEEYSHSKLHIDTYREFIKWGKRSREELEAFETFIKQLRKIRAHSDTVGIENPNFGRAPEYIPGGKTGGKIAEEICYIKTLAGISPCAGIEKSSGDTVQDLANLARDCDRSIVAIQTFIQQEIECHKQEIEDCHKEKIAAYEKTKKLKKPEKNKAKRKVVSISLIK
jgi:hypothetical protein